MPRVEELPEDAPQLDMGRQDEDPKDFVGELLKYLKTKFNLALEETLNAGERFRNNAANHLLVQGELVGAEPNQTIIVIFLPGADDHRQPVQKKVVIEKVDGKLSLFPYNERTLFILQQPEKIGIAYNEKGNVYPATIPVVLASITRETI